ncbi:hypothetical protein DIPPA_27889 [Diplonema papillatum]|nr:hypothetical protein DIPPA_27889 [Diplonema papillatum]
MTASFPVVGVPPTADTLIALVSFSLFPTCSTAGGGSVAFNGGSFGVKVLGWVGAGAFEAATG